MIGPNRAAATLLGAAAAAVLLWVAAQFNMHTTGGYWAALGVVAGGGLVLGVLQMRGRTGHPPAMLTVFVPVFVVSAWVLLAMQPHDVWGRHLILGWSNDIHVTGIVRDVGMWVGVIAFGLGYVLGTVLEPAPARRDEEVVARRPATAATTTPAATTDPVATTGDDGFVRNPEYDRERAYADEPTTAERRELETERGATTYDGGQTTVR